MHLQSRRQSALKAHRTSNERDEQHGPATGKHRICPAKTETHLKMWRRTLQKAFYLLTSMYPQSRTIQSSTSQGATIIFQSPRCITSTSSKHFETCRKVRRIFPPKHTTAPRPEVRQHAVVRMRVSFQRPCAVATSKKTLEFRRLIKPRPLLELVIMTIVDNDSSFNDRAEKEAAKMLLPLLRA